MKSVNIAQLKNHLSTYLGYARNGEEIVIRDRNLPVAKLIPFPPGDAAEDELLLVAAGKMRLQEAPLDLKALRNIRAPKVPGHSAIQALLDERESGR